MSDLPHWLKHIEAIHPKEIDMGLSRLSSVANNIGIKKSFHCPTVTVGGTNGKGSCVAALSEIAQAAGLNVATYTSPHLFHFNERIQVNSQPVSNEKLCEAFEIIEAKREEIPLTFFEFTTLAALWIFQQQKLDLVLLEVGLGGRLDAVNFINSDIAVITTIDRDHMDYLGDDRDSIAREKAGIFRKQSVAVCGDFNIPDAINKQAKALGTHLFSQNNDFGFAEKPELNTWDYWSLDHEYYELARPKIALQNAATVLKVCECLQPHFDLPEESIRQGLARVSLTGRIQVMPGDILQIIDVSHNQQSCQYLSDYVKNETNTAQRRIAVFSALAGKEIESLIKPFLGLMTHWHIAPLKSSRAAPLTEISAVLRKFQQANVEEHENIGKAHQAALATAQSGDCLVIYGSFYTVAEVLSPHHY